MITNQPVLQPQIPAVQNNHASQIKVFTEQSRVENTDDTKRLSAHTLFSSFTADIIRENAAFTR